MSEIEDDLKTVSDDGDTSDYDEGPSSSKRQRKSLNQVYNPPASSWTLEEKKQMLDALKEYGVGNLSALAGCVPTKSENEINEFMKSKYKKLKYASLDKEDKGDTPIDKWITELCKKIPNEDYKFSIISRVMKYIALFEDREDENESSTGVNLGDAYLILSSLLSGKGPKYGNRETSCFLYDILQEFVKDMKQLEFGPDRTHLTLNSHPGSVRKCYGKVKTTEVTPDKDSVSNPLNIPKEVL